MTNFTLTLTDHSTITIKATSFDVNAKNQLTLTQWDHGLVAPIPVALFDAGRWVDVVQTDTIVEDQPA